MCLLKYGIELYGASDLFGKKGQKILDEKTYELPIETAKCVGQQLSMLDQIEVCNQSGNQIDNEHPS